ncbi:MAG: HAMP domain-containing protein [Myxococcales bacterium]|nr:HAMP domain-containing protein [Sorangiineae bacterium PRO1]MCL4753633.1 HAMP domain-containing protein [Myxococcales bacterium]
MTLAQRLLVATLLLTVVTTVTMGFGVREAWRRTEEERFREQGAAAFQRLERQLGTAVRDLPELVGPLCKHDPMVDSALVGLKARDLDSRRLSLSLRVPELMKALRLDELTLVTSEGEVLGAGHADGLTGKRDKKLAERLQGAGGSARLRTGSPPLAVEAGCLVRDQENKKLWVGLYAARHLDPMLQATAEAHGVRLSLSRPSSGGDMITAVTIQELGGMTLFASQSRVPLARALQALDSTIIVIGAGSFGAALLMAMLLSRGLARPIVKMAAQAREVAVGEPKPVKGEGGKELVELANAFNQAIADLTQLRKRLAATERIAARREIARRVAHEIKNPLAPIRAAVETLRRLRARDDPAFDEYFDEATRTVLEEVTRISNIVSEFTRFARLPPPNPAPTELAEVAKKVVNLHASSGAELELVVSQVPIVNADADQMVQVLTNLIQNAIDAAKARPDPRVTVELRPHGPDRVVLSVRDNGPGVPPELRDRLFEPYVTTKPEGTGLGLAIVHRIVVEHGGEILHADAAGGGALFTVILPVAGPTLLSEAPVPSSA